MYIEIGAKRVFAGAVDWPGWSRSGRDEAAALDSLIASAPRYARVVGRSRLGFRAPADAGGFRVVERVRGGATTDFGAPGAPPRADSRRVAGPELLRLRTILTAGWRALDDAALGARGKTLAKGPRGGGRDLDGILRHVREAEAVYLSALGRPFRDDPRASARAELERTRAAVLEGLAASARGEIPQEGPRGGRRWKARFFARRLAWHTLDHLWEIEDRAGR